MKKFVVMYDIDEEAVQARHTIAEWESIINDEFGAVTTSGGDDWNDWESIYTAIIWEFVFSGDYTDLVAEVYANFPTAIDIR